MRLDHAGVNAVGERVVRAAGGDAEEELGLLGEVLAGVIVVGDGGRRGRLGRRGLGREGVDPHVRHRGLRRGAGAGRGRGVHGGGPAGGEERGAQGREDPDGSHPPMVAAARPGR